MFISIASQAQQTPEILGGKGYSLWDMARHGVRVPTAYILPVSVCHDYYVDGPKTMAKIKKALAKIMGKFEGHLLAVRSGAAISMPGMMDTILNVGITPDNFESVKAKLGESVAIDCQKRLQEQWSKLVGVPANTVEEQVLLAIEAVFRSWNNERARYYRKKYNIPNTGTACIVQVMVFGNKDAQSCTGVVFTRDPDTGENKVTGEFLPQAQGEDVVDGSHTPFKLDAMAQWNPKVHKELCGLAKSLEAGKGDVRDIEFTVESGKLFLLQCRSAKLSARASLQVALDMVKEGMVPADVACGRVPVRAYSLAQRRVILKSPDDQRIGAGIPGCPGVATGRVVFTAQAAIACQEPCILVTEQTTPDDIAGMDAAAGVLTMAGGSTCHAAVVARGMNKPCVVGLGEDLTEFVAEGQIITIDGSTGLVYTGEVPTVDGDPQLVAQFEALLLQAGGAIPMGKPLGKECFILADNTCVLRPKEVVEELATLIKQHPDTQFVLVDEVTDAEVAYLTMFGAQPIIAEAEYYAALAQRLPVADVARVKVCTAGDAPVFPFERIDHLSNLPQVITSNGGVVTAVAPAEEAALRWVLERKPGASFYTIGGTVPGVKSVLSVPQALNRLCAP